jgi:hypothetical protein
MGTPYGTRSWTKAFSGSTYLADVDLPAVIQQLITPMERRMGERPFVKYDWLPCCLHEAMHHSCWTTKCGYANSLLHIRVRCFAVQEELTFTSERRWLFVTSWVRAHLLEALLDALGEGLALFMEMDVVPGRGRVLSRPMELVYRYAMRKIGETKAETEEILREALWIARIGSSSLACPRRKENLLSGPLTGHESQYLAGYLAVKSLYSASVRKCPALSDRDLFAAFLSDFFFNDLGCVAVLLDDTAESIEPMLKYFSARWHQFLTCNLPIEVRRFEDHLNNSSPEDRTHVDHWTIAGTIERCVKGAALLERLGEELYSWQGEYQYINQTAAFYSHLHNQSSYFRVGYIETNVRVTDEGRYFATLPDDTSSILGPRDKYASWQLELYGGIPFLTGSVKKEWPITSGEGPGRVEVLYSDWEEATILLVSRGTAIVECKIVAGKHSSRLEGKIRKFVSSTLIEEHEDRMKQYLLKFRVNEDKSLPEFAEPFVDKGRRLAHGLCLEQIFSRQDQRAAAACISRMSKHGVHELLGEDSRLLRALSRLSVLAPFDASCVTARRGEEEGWWPGWNRFEELLNVQKETGFPLIAERRKRNCFLRGLFQLCFRLKSHAEFDFLV